jgi:hypothetical protein
VKIRQGFVSNSSSSSFIIAVKDPKNLTCKLTFDIDLSDFTGEEQPIKTEKELTQFFLEDRYCKEEDLASDGEYKDCLKEIRKGNSIIMLSCSSDGSDKEQLLCSKGLNDIKSKNITVIRGDGGY